MRTNDAAPGGIAVAADALSLNGGGIRSTAGAPAVLDLGTHAIRRDWKHRVNGSVATVPQVQGLWVSTCPSKGTAYGAGEEIKVRVAFDLPLKVTGTPQLALSVGDCLRQARYSGIGVSRSSLVRRPSLCFGYLVQAEDSAPGGIGVAADALSLNGGSIRSTAGAPAVLDLERHEFWRDSKHRVNGSILTAPRVRGVQVSSHPSNGTAYGAGEKIEVRVAFDLPLKVAGSPQLALTVGDCLRQARYWTSSWSGRSLIFWYLVQAEDSAPGGITVAVDALRLDGGSIRSTAAAAAVLDLGTHVFTRDSEHKVDGSIATVPKVKRLRVFSRPSNGTAYGVGEIISVVVSFTVPVTVTGIPRLVLNVGEHRRNVWGRMSTSLSNSIFFKYRVQVEDAAPEGIAIAPDALSLNAGRIRSNAGISAIFDLGSQNASRQDSRHRVDGSIVPDTRNIMSGQPHARKV